MYSPKCLCEIIKKEKLKIKKLRIQFRTVGKNKEDDKKYKCRNG